MLPDPRFQQKKDSFADLLCTIVVLARGTANGGKPHWAYVALKPSMALSFKEACKVGNVDLGHYGTVLESGEGVEPSPDIRERMKRDFGVQEDFEEKLKAAIEKHAPA